MARKPEPRGRAPGGGVRIIGGRWRGRRLPVPHARGLRPSTDRVRETVFNWLAPRTAGSRVADLFAGTGLLGLEALSRGAAAAVFVEQDRRLCVTLEKCLAGLGASGAEVVNEDAYRWLARAQPMAFDIVFLDPPYAHGRLSELCTLLAGRGWLADRALVYLEHDRRSPPELPPAFRPWREKAAGNVSFKLLEQVQGTACGGES